MITTGQRIRYLRIKKGLTMKQLGQLVGFPESNADIRISQYENDTRTPMPVLTEKFSNALGVPSYYLSMPAPSTPEELAVREYWSTHFL